MRELIVDSFAGGGGASTGIEMALGISPDIAINHDDVAMAMHRINHPTTLHVPHNIWKVDPTDVCKGRPIGLLWASPDCKHFSKAKGGKPVEKSIRDLAWVIVRWAKQVAPRVIMMENVEEFKTWGPLGVDNKPCKDRKGQEFERFIKELKRLGYKVQWRELRACDYGAPTIRKRLFLIARRDGLPIVWPEPTHGNPKSEEVISGKLLPWRTAAEIIDWSLPCHSIFLTPAEAKVVGVKRPLAHATMARIAKGVKRYVIDAAEPFIVNLTHHGGERGEAVTDPVMTVTGAHRGEKAIVVPDLAGPFVTGVGGRMGQTEPRDVRQPAQTMTAKADSVVIAPVVTYAQQGGATREADGPLHTVTASRKDANGIIVPTLVQIGYGEREGQEPRVPGLEHPLGTIVAGGVKHALSAPFLARTAHGEQDKNGKKRGRGDHSLEEPFSTVLASPDHSLIVPHLNTNRNAEKPFNEANKPTHVITAGGAHLNLIAAHLTKFRKGNSGVGMDQPAPTVTANSFIDRPGGAAPIGLVAASIVKNNFGDKPASGADEPLHTVTTQSNRFGMVAAFLAQYNNHSGTDPHAGRDLKDPASSVTTEGPHQAVVAAEIVNLKGSDRRGSDPEAPAPTQTADGNHIAATAAFLTKAHGSGGQHQTAEDPLHTVDCKDRFAAVTVNIKGEPYIIADIGMRMLVPRELFRAQGFPETYIIDRGICVETGAEIRITKTDQVSKCGNSVCPPLAEALVGANFSPLEVGKDGIPDFRLEAAE